MTRNTGTLNPISRRTAISGGVQWFADIICHLRDDLATENPAQALPQNGDIRNWVAESYYPGLLELTWEEAVLSLLSRMQPCRTDFAEIAMAQLRRATRNSQIWHM